MRSEDLSGRPIHWSMRNDIRFGKENDRRHIMHPFETVKVSDPFVFLEADRAHNIYMSKEDDDRKGVYEGLVEETGTRSFRGDDAEIFAHNSVVYRYSDMLRKVNDIFRSVREQFGRFVDFYVNISFGSSEYATASMCHSLCDAIDIPFDEEHHL